MSHKNVDQKGRLRDKTIAFRVSPKENEILEEYVKLSGLTKQEYLIHNMLHQQINVTGNPRVFKALKHELNLIVQKLETMDRFDFDEEQVYMLLYKLELIQEMMK